jgi:Arylsulfotransferase (ASST)
VIVQAQPPATTRKRQRRLLFGGSLLVLLASVTTLALASRRIQAEQAAFTAPSAGRCMPTTLNRSAVLPGTPVAVTPLPDSYDALPRTQISFLGAPVRELSKITVSGSSTGAHTGLLRAYSQGDGASFVPTAPFKAGETVTVRGLLDSGGHSASLAFHFVIAREDVLPHPSSSHPIRDPNEKQHYHTRPDLEPPAMVISAHSPSSAPGYIFTAPYNGPGRNGPMIFDESGNLIWYDALPAEVEASNLQVQQLAGKPVLSWWQGYIPPQGFGQGEEIIADSSYRQIGRVHAGNGYKADLHDFHITASDTALLTAFSPIACDLSSVGGPRGGAVTDTLFQEIDLHTGLVRREWHSVDHVALGDSYSTAVTTSTTWPFDYFHINSMDQHADGTTLISARNTWALYELNTTTGQILSQIGGKHSTVNMLDGTRTAYQHDAALLPNGNISIFDNGGVPKVHPQSRVLIERINPIANTANYVAAYEHTAPLLAGSQGNVQLLANGDYFVGWGASPYFSEFSASGQLLFDAHMHGSYQAYRGYRFQWTGAPVGAPSIALTSAGKKVTVYSSWNGDTRTATWQLLAGSSATHLKPVARAARTGFETALTAPASAAYYAVQALDASGAAIGTSHPIKG